MNEQIILEEFITKRLGCEIIYHPEKFGFVYFRALGDLCNILELYVSDEHRGAGVAGWLVASVEAKAKEHNCKHVGLTVAFTTQTAEQALAAAIHCGFKVGEFQGNSIFMLKEI